MDEFHNKKSIDFNEIDYDLWYIFEGGEDGAFGHIDTWEKFQKARDPKYGRFKSWSFITLSPDHIKRGFKYPEDFGSLKMWCEEYFSPNIYEKYAWVIESGKHVGRPHLHIHFICQIRPDRSKKHKVNLTRSWAKYFPNNQLIGDDYHVIRCNTQEIVDDKMGYLINERKGSHMNFEDLAPHGGMGAVGVLLPI